MRSVTPLIGAALAVVLLLPPLASAHEDAKDLPAGPIRERHELMKKIGDHAKKIGDANKAGKTATVAGDAEAISQLAMKIDALFPPGSTHEKSRAKPEIWTQWPEFQHLSKGLVDDSGALAKAAGQGGDVHAASQKMFGNCKSCHDKFRKPEKKEGH
jgi:cytochrome c556